MSEKRPFDWFSLSAGILFVALGAAFILRGTGHLEFSGLWALPVLIAGLVIAGIVGGVGRTRQRQG
ncbi:hypothetical protein J4H86_20030 [Spiractinospora alimapuensis]|uniref:hypothetical protein n=1 Tax=Spiractinospora alimapuensis TaxID=2820884 RepID=UPI001F3768DA|nr:hypothetical protein [Spiractinospora alimapuensis]QVQ51102.1 hypothetical protein J4H86_20030 [Spiractinospora alimapuensis]